MLHKEDIRAELEKAVSDICYNEKMSAHTSFKIGGAADIYLMPRNESELVNALRIAESFALPFFILGRGSDMLVSDSGYRGAVISTERLNAVSLKDEDIIEAGAGIGLGELAREAMRLGLGGMEFASGIPGSLGGAVFMNAGAYGGEMKDIISEVRILEEDRESFWVPADALELGYRSSNIERLKRVVTAARLRLFKKDREKIEAKMNDLNRRRADKQPLEFPSAGSTFKRPEGYFAGKLISDAGLRGFKVGGAMVSEKHCGFVINHDNASAEDVYRLIEEVQTRVMEKFGVRLEREVRLLGEFK